MNAPEAILAMCHYVQASGIAHRTQPDPATSPYSALDLVLSRFCTRIHRLHDLRPPYSIFSATK